MYSKYVVKLNNGRLFIYKAVKGVFKEKLKRITLKDFYLSGKNSLRKRKQYEIIPDLTGLSSSSYLYQKALYNLDNQESDFGVKTIWKIKNPSVNTKILNKDGFDIYETSLEGDLLVTDEKGRVIIETPGYHYRHLGQEEVDVKFIELLNQNACNGVFQTARETYELVSLFSKNAFGIKAVLKCEECGEIFDSIPALFSHLIENKHFDSILETHIYDEEVARIKHLVTT